MVSINTRALVSNPYILSKLDDDYTVTGSIKLTYPVNTERVYWGGTYGCDIGTGEPFLNPVNNKKYWLVCSHYPANYPNNTILTVENVIPHLALFEEHMVEYYNEGIAENSGQKFKLVDSNYQNPNIEITIKFDFSDTEYTLRYNSTTNMIMWCDENSDIYQQILDNGGYSAEGNILTIVNLKEV